MAELPDSTAKPTDVSVPMPPGDLAPLPETLANGLTPAAPSSSLDGAMESKAASSTAANGSTGASPADVAAACAKPATDGSGTVPGAIATVAMSSPPCTGTDAEVRPAQEQATLSTVLSKQVQADCSPVSVAAVGDTTSTASSSSSTAAHTSAVPSAAAASAYSPGLATGSGAAAPTSTSMATGTTVAGEQPSQTASASDSAQSSVPEPVPGPSSVSSAAPTATASNSSSGSGNAGQSEKDSTSVASSSAGAGAGSSTTATPSTATATLATSTSGIPTCQVGQTTRGSGGVCLVSSAVSAVSASQTSVPPSNVATTSTAAAGKQLVATTAAVQSVGVASTAASTATSSSTAVAASGTPTTSISIQACSSAFSQSTPVSTIATAAVASATASATAAVAAAASNLAQLPPGATLATQPLSAVQSQLQMQHITQQINAQIQMVHPAATGAAVQRPIILQSLPSRGRPSGPQTSAAQLQGMAMRAPTMTPEEQQHYRQQQFNRSLAIVSQAIIPAIRKVEGEIQQLRTQHAQSGTGPLEQLPAYTMKQQRLQQLTVAYKKQMEQQQILSGFANPGPIPSPLNGAVAAAAAQPAVLSTEQAITAPIPTAAVAPAAQPPAVPHPAVVTQQTAAIALPFVPSIPTQLPSAQVQHTQHMHQQMHQHQQIQQIQILQQQQMQQRMLLAQQQQQAHAIAQQHQQARAQMALAVQQSTPKGGSSRRQQQKLQRRSGGNRRKRARSSSEEEELEEESEESMPDTPPLATPEMSASSQSLRRSSRRSTARKKKYVDDVELNLSDSDHDGDKSAGAPPKIDPVVAMQERGEPIPLHLTHFQNDMSEDNANVVDKILSVRNRQPKDGEVANCADGTLEEYYVKFKNFSYLHCEWATADKLSIGDKRVHQKAKRFWIKRNSPANIFAMDDEEPFNQDYVEVERVLEEAIEDGVVTHYLVKWCALPYEESTWELPQDVPELPLSQWRVRNKLPPVHEMQFVRRPGPEKWQRLPATPAFKNENRLRDYQLEGVNWLMFRWHNHESCILADEMGLGKTIQAVSFLSQIQKFGISRPFLVIAPLSTIHNWQREVETWTDMNCLVYHGSSYSRRLITDYELYYRDEKLEIIPGAYKFHVIVTTYEMILTTDDPTLSSIMWRAVVIDEAHRLKNRNCKLIEGLDQLKMEHKVLLTGTPLQNNVEELYNLLSFLQPQRFSSEADFMAEFGNLKTESQVDKLQQLLKPMMLRRIKQDVEKNIAPKEETVIEVELTTTQKKFYRAILERNFAFLSRGGSTHNMPSLMNTMMELRKCCNHPFLINGAEERIVGEYCQAQDLKPVELKQEQSMKVLIEASGKLVLIDKLLPKLKAGGHKVLIFSQMVRCLDILEDYLRYRRYVYERIDGGVRGNLRQAAIDRFSKPDSDRFVFLLCTRAGGLGINLTAADCCIIFDSDWNPQNDLQAQARCHRIGQSKAVAVYRLITRNSYEREMFDRASMKLGLDRAVLQNICKGAAGGNPSQVLGKRDVEDLLRRGAYGAVMDEDNDADKFCEEDIEQILSRRTQVINVETEGPGSTFSKASFVSDNGATDIDVDDPNFWQKWAMKAEIDPDAYEDQLIIDAPRQRKQTRRFGNDEGLEVSDIEDLGSDSDAKAHQSTSKVTANRGKAWSRYECFRIEKNLQTFGWGRWEDIAYHPPMMMKKTLGPLDAEAMCRAVLVYCIQHHHGEEKLRTYAEGLVRAEPSLDVTDDNKRKAAKRSKKYFKRDVSEIAMRGYDYLFGLDLLNLFTDERYRKHMQQHANKILTRIKMLHVLSNEVVAEQAQRIMDGMPSSDLHMDFTLAEEHEPPSPWWDEECDRSLLVGAYKHGYERFSAMRSDPLLCFLDRCGPAPVVKRNRTGNGTGNGAGGGEDDDLENMEAGSDEEAEEECKKETSTESSEQPTEEDVAEGLLPWPVPMDVNTRLRRLVAAYQRQQKKHEQQQVQKEAENRRKEKHAAVQKKKDTRRMEQEQRWSKREEHDFLRTVTSFGVVYMAESDSYDWNYFRSLAKLERKTDDRLTDYYTAFIHMCRVVTHIVPATVADPITVSTINEDRAMRALSRIDLLSTIREEVLRHAELDRRLSLCQLTSDVPEWWQCGLHDRSLLLGVARYGLSRTEYTILCDPNLLFCQVLNYAAQELGLPVPTFEPVEQAKSIGEASSNDLTECSARESNSGNGRAEAKSSSASSKNQDSTDDQQAEPSGSMQISIAPEIIAHVKWPKERHIVRRLQTLVYTVMHGSWPVAGSASAMEAGSVAYAADFDPYDNAAFEDDPVYSSPEASDTEEVVQKKAADFKVKRGDGLKMTFKTSKTKGLPGSSPSPSPSVSGHSSPASAARVPVVHRPTGRKLVGQQAPQQHRLKDWLKSHPDYSVMQDLPERRTSSRTPSRGYSSTVLAETEESFDEQEGEDFSQDGDLDEDDEEAWQDASHVSQVGKKKKVHKKSKKSKSKKSKHREEPVVKARAEPPAKKKKTASTIPASKHSSAAAKLTGEERVSVVNRTSGRKIAGKAAPTLRKLDAWLDRNPGFDVAESWSAVVLRYDALPSRLLNRVPSSGTPAGKSASLSKAKHSHSTSGRHSASNGRHQIQDDYSDDEDDYE